MLGSAQFVRGYSLILPDPVAGDLNQLNGPDRKTLLYEMSVVGDALLEVTNALRINYEMLGNVEPALHAHIFPRYEDEPDDLKTQPVWFYDWDNGPQFDLGRDKPLMDKIHDYIQSTGIVV